MYKLSRQSGEEWVQHSHPPVFTTETTSAQSLRLVAGVPGGDPAVLLKLIECLAQPFFVLYVLHTPRGEGEPGRYQSPELGLCAIQAFVSRYAPFFVADARFDLWVHSPSTGGTLVWDRHNLIHGYGPIECFGSALKLLGFSEGKPHILGPHLHHYRPEFDDDAAAILSAFSWQHFPLRPEDEQ
jgi:hypothetical protein